MVLRGGEVILECSASGYSVNEWHVSHSMAKTICGMIIGRLVDDGKLLVDTPLVEIFPEIPYRDRKFSFITINHLLSMTSGVDFAEVGAITESDWITAFFSSAVKFTPGTKFAYNSMNSYILARIAKRVSGVSFSELADGGSRALLLREGAHTVFDVMQWAAERRIPLLRLEREEPTLESLLMEVTEK
jgi:hypothetical protein